jgi:hypothetical protein
MKKPATVWHTAAGFLPMRVPRGGTTAREDGDDVSS